MSPGRVHFLNIQKLAKDTGLVKRGDERNFTIWQTVANTVARRGHQLFLLIDEAHRGTSERQSSRDEATSIVQKFIKGSQADALPAIPVIAGISATPERFQKLVAGTGRVQCPVEVPPDDVRASGLLKDFIDLRHPKETAAADMTLLKEAAKSWHQTWNRWEAFCEESGDPVVRPIFVVQVEDATAKQLTKTNLEQCVRTIRGAVGKAADKLLPARAFAHAFQEEKPAPIGGAEIRHVKPSDIADDAEVRVVFFKTSLNTGWDCPRAETMMSFRTALDATSIAQLVGRMVRTPLARRVEADESLNSVSLYLPHYDAENLDKVVEKLTGDPDTGLPVEVRKGEDVVDLVRAANSDELFAALAALPSYFVPKTHRIGEVKRLTRLAFLLANDAIDADAIDSAASTLLAVLKAEYAKRKDSKTFKKLIDATSALDISGRRVRLGVAEEGALDEKTVTRELEDIDLEFEEAGRKLGEGLHKRWWRARVDPDDSARDVAKLEIIALAADASVRAALEDAARTKTQGWLKAYSTEIKALPESGAQAYSEIRQLATKTELQDRDDYPLRIQTSKADKRWAMHVYVDPAGLVPAKFNKWERKVLEEALANKDEIIGWLRNPPRKPWSLTVPYSRGGEAHPQYPDFLVLRRRPKGGIAVDLLEPHMTDLADAAAKAKGLAEYADSHADDFDRIEFIIVDKERVIRLDLTNETWRKKVLVFADGGDTAKLEALLKEVADAPAID